MSPGMANAGDALISTVNYMLYFLVQNETLIAIKAPHGTTLEVPDPDEVVSKA